MKSIVPISKFKAGETIQGFYLCVEKHIRHTRAGDLYLDLVLRDQTGQIHGKVWDKVSEYNADRVGLPPTCASGNQCFSKTLNKPQTLSKNSDGGGSSK